MPGDFESQIQTWIQLSQTTPSMRHIADIRYVTVQLLPLDFGLVLDPMLRNNMEKLVARPVPELDYPIIKQEYLGKSTTMLALGLAEFPFVDPLPIFPRPNYSKLPQSQSSVRVKQPADKKLEDIVAGARPVLKRLCLEFARFCLAAPPLSPVIIRQKEFGALDGYIRV